MVTAVDVVERFRRLKILVGNGSSKGSTLWIFQPLIVFSNLNAKFLNQPSEFPSTLPDPTQLSATSTTRLEHMAHGQLVFESG